MPAGRRWLPAALAAVAAAGVPAALSASEAAGSASADRGRLVTTYRGTDVQLVGGTADEPSIKNVTLVCPKGARLVSGSWSTVVNHGFVSTRGEIRGPDTYFVQLAFVPVLGEDRQMVHVWIACEEARTTTKPPQRVTLPPLTLLSEQVALSPPFTSASLQCPVGSFPVYGGIPAIRYEGVRMPAGTLSETEAATVEVVGSHMSDAPPKWWWTLRGATVGTVSVQAGCLKDTVAMPKPKQKRTREMRSPAGIPQANPSPLKLRFRISREIQTLETAGLNRVTATCKPTEQAVGGGYSLLAFSTPPGPPAFLGTEIAKQSYTAHYWLGETPGKPPQVAVFAACLTTRIP